MRPGGKRILLLTSVLFSLAAGQTRAEENARAAPLAPPAAATYDAFTQFARFLETVLKNYVEPARFNDLGRHSTAALRAFLRSLDPEADLFTPAEAAARAQPLPADVVPFGAVLTIVEDTPTIVSTHAGSPAQQAGLLPGERILAINDEVTVGARVFDVVRALGGKADSQCILKILAPGTGTRTIVVKRNTSSPSVPVPFVMLTQTVAYVRLPEFGFAMTEGLLRHVDTVRAKNGLSLIIDLRNNPGGMLDATVMAASLFLPAKAEIVSLRTAQRENAAPFVSSHPDPLRVPMIVLVNGATAAEAEVFAVALQTHGVARLVGTRTAGRGRQSNEFTLPDGAVVRLPTTEFQAPSGATFHGQGLTPDVVVELPRETERMLTGVGFGNFEWSTNPQRILATDRQLATALKLLSPTP